MEALDRIESTPRTAPLAIVLVGGDAVAASLGAGLPDADLVIAADSGLAQAAALGLAVDTVIGDMDSVDAQMLADAEAAGTTIERYPADKDATDMELALGRAQSLGVGSVLVVGGEGGRIDHLLGNALLLASPRFASVNIEWRQTDSTIFVVRAGRSTSIDGAPGEIVTLLPVGGEARGITTSGLRWTLADDSLASGSTLGISNEMMSAVASVTLTSGTLLAIHLTTP